MAFNFNPINGLLDPNTFPTNPGSETEARQQFMVPLNQIKDYINGMQNYKLTADDGGVKGTATNLNDLKTSGRWYFDETSTNKPFVYGIVEVIQGTVQHLFQIAYQITSSVSMAIRRSSNGGATWSGWESNEPYFGANGYQKFTSGVTIQWGQISLPANTSSYVVNFPISFPNTCINVQCTNIYTNAKVIDYSIGGVLKESFTVFPTRTDLNNIPDFSVQFNWLAIGY